MTTFKKGDTVYRVIYFTGIADNKPVIETRKLETVTAKTLRLDRAFTGDVHTTFHPGGDLRFYATQIEAVWAFGEEIERNVAPRAEPGARAEAQPIARSGSARGSRRPAVVDSYEPDRRIPRVVITHGMAGWFASLWRYSVSSKGTGYWEPQCTGIGRYSTPEEADEEARDLAEASAAIYDPPRALRWPDGTYVDLCCSCEQPLLPRNLGVADGCPCNAPRGVNHGIVGATICTCDVCDPASTGASRYRP